MNQPYSKMRISLQEFLELSNQLDITDGYRGRGSGDGCTDAQSPPWQGSIVVESIRPGFHIYIVDIRPPVDVELSYEITEPAVGFALVLEGNPVQTNPGKDERVSVLPVTAGQNLAAVCRPEKAHLHLPGGQWHRFVKLQINSEEMSSLLDGQEGQIPEALRPVILPSRPWRPWVQNPLSPALECIGHQMINCPFTGAARRLFLEGKALEILAEELGGAGGTASREKESYSRDEIDRLELARTILEQEYNNPPTILDLSRRVFLNDFKLKRGFKDLWGTTIFGYVRKLRMEKARALLEEGTYNVTEVALKTGHSCLGHFAAAFKKTFGVVPSRYRSGSRESARAI
jgi:AraC-like DNA-binding protein